jgi:copper transport protein
MELTAVQQVWSTSYGRSLIAKTALFVALVAIGWLNRMRLLRRFERLRRSVSAELVLLLAVVGVVAVLTELRPGRDAARVVSAPSTAATLPQPVRLPSLDGVVDARELGAYAVAVARTSDAAMLTLLGPDGNGVDGRRVTIDGHAAAGCGSGCYRAPAGAGPLHVVVDRRPLTFTVAAAAPPASRLLAAVTTRYRSLRSVVFRERLSSSPRDHIETMFVAVAPDRLRYRTANGPSAIVIGDRRWDSSAPGRRYVESAQTPLRPLQPYWRTPTNVHLVAPHELTFLDRSIPAWFRVTLRGTLPRVVHMTAAAHFMVDRYVRFDAPEDVSPPPSR